MIKQAHPVLRLLDESQWTFHLIGSRYVGKFDRDSDYDLLMEVESGMKWSTAREWLEANGFARQHPGGYGPDPRMVSDDSWTATVEGHPDVDVLPVTAKEAEFRMRWLGAMKKCGDSKGGLLAKALKAHRLWPNLWNILAEFEKASEK